MTLRGDPTRALQLGFLALLAVSTAQVGWWIADQVGMAEAKRTEVAGLYRADAQAARAILLRDADPALAERLAQLMPHLAIDQAGAVRVQPGATSALAEEANSRINRYAWEGGFFLLVLLAGMLVLARAIRQDAQLRRRQQNFLATVSHEFKSPLASMRLSAETLALRAADADGRRLGQRLIEDGERLLNMVDNLLDTTRIEEGELELKPEAVPLAPLAQAVAGRLGEEAAGNRIVVRSDVPAGLDLRADRAALETVLRNLLANALKACIARTGTRAAGEGGRIAITAERQGEKALIRVADDGAGFAPADARRLFEKFYRAPQSSSPGTGLGLYIVARVAALSGAEVSAHSAGPGKGATLTLTWPLAR